MKAWFSTKQIMVYVFLICHQPFVASSLHSRLLNIFPIWFSGPSSIMNNSMNAWKDCRQQWWNIDQIVQIFSKEEVFHDNSASLILFQTASFSEIKAILVQLLPEYWSWCFLKLWEVKICTGLSRFSAAPTCVEAVGSAAVLSSAVHMFSKLSICQESFAYGQHLAYLLHDYEFSLRFEERGKFYRYILTDRVAYKSQS